MSKIFNISPRSVMRLARLNKTEAVIIRVLKDSKKPLTVKGLINLLKEERLTIFYNLRKLEKRGLLKRDKTSRAHTWSVAIAGADKEKILKTQNNQLSIGAGYDVLHASRQHRLFSIQGTNAVKSTSDMIRMGRSFTKTHTRQKLRQVIIDGILTDTGVTIMKGLPRNLLKSHFGRPSILHIIPHNPAISDYEIVSDGKTLLIINHADGTCVISDEEGMISGFLALHETVKNGGKKVNPVEVYGEFSG